MSADLPVAPRKRFAGAVFGVRRAVLLAVAMSVAVLGSACSGSGTDPRASAPPEAAVSDAAPADGLGQPTSAQAASQEQEDRESSADTPSEISDTADGTDGNPGAELDDVFTPYEERVRPLSAFLAELEQDVYAYTDYPDPMATIEDMKFDCMTEQGFRYARIDWDAINAEFEAASPSLAEEDYMPTRGYGVADSLDAPEAIEIDDPYVDPNNAIKEGLSAAELEAWEAQRIECVTLAQHEVLHRPGYFIIRFALRDELAALADRIAADPRLVEENRLWAECMAEQGHHYANKDEIFDYLHSISEPLLERLAALGGHDRIDAAFQADLDALMATEVEIAVADLACKRPLEQIQYEVKVEHEQQFLEDHEDRLALLRQELPTMSLPPIDDPERRAWSDNWLGNW